MTITIRPRWSLGRGKTLVPSRWQATAVVRRRDAAEGPAGSARGRRLDAWLHTGGGASAETGADLLVANSAGCGTTAPGKAVKVPRAAAARIVGGG
jgi:hypothetical protein